MSAEPDVQYVVTTVGDVQVTVLRSEGTVVMMPPENQQLPGYLVFSPGQAFQLGRALCELGFFNEEGIR